MYVIILVYILRLFCIYMFSNGSLTFIHGSVEVVDFKDNFKRYSLV